MKVFLEPTGIFSRAMVRIANALAAHAPPHVQVVRSRSKADLVFMYVIGPDAIKAGESLAKSGQRYVILQCCLDSAVPDRRLFHQLWRNAAVVWSYYNLHNEASDVGFRFYFSPLGVDPCFLSTLELDPSYIAADNREPSIITCGFVSGSHPGAEPIEEVWIAAAGLNIPVAHLGPSDVKGITRRFPNVTCVQPADGDLVRLYLKTRWVAALRHLEGFELPAAEALVCGARPIVFSQPATRHWYEDLVTYLPDTNGQRLIDRLSATLRSSRPVSTHERLRARARFSWTSICTGLWEQVEKSVRDGTGPPRATGAFYRRGKTPTVSPTAAVTAATATAAVIESVPLISTQEDKEF